ncbi:putative 1-phosphatidylinositol-4-phosphate 5-kinase [Helianthus annuus]|nr:putative 1-phosphatidylinositol-4-phosphate 5-kinase [Helianthus annuus]
MRQKKTGLQIGEEPVSRFPNLQIELPTRNHDEQTPNFKKLTSTTTTTTTTQKPLYSNPQKRPVVMSPQLKTSPTHLHHNHNHNHQYHPYNHSRRNSQQKSLICCSSSEALLATKTIALKVLNFTYFKLIWIKVPFRVLILLFLPSVYYFSLSYRSFYLYILFVVAFFGVVLSSFNINSFHAANIPSIRLFVARNFPNLKLYKSGHDGSNSNSSSKSHPPVVWSIGSKTRLEEKSNSDYKYDGYGVETWAKGSRYRGQYRQGLRHGYGVYRFYTGDTYAGEWFKGQCHGCGVHTCEDGSKYSGEFKGGIKHGLGHYRFRNGDTYAGEYFADKMHGFGVYRFANGHRYEGGWHEGRRQGFGMYTFRNGDTQSGHWDNGVLTVSTSKDSFISGSSSSVSHVKVLKAVQEARRIAEKAVAAADVDERVNRAVTAANRAANAARVAAVKAVQNQMHQHGDIDDQQLDIV